MTLAFIPTGLPPARQALVDHVATGERIARQLQTLRSGRARLADQLELIDGAEHELEGILAGDTATLLDRIRGGLEAVLAGLAGPRATKIAESLAASRLQHQIGQRAKAEIDAEIASLEAEIGTLRAQKPSLIAAVLREAAQGYLNDFLTVLEELRDLMVVLSSLERFMGVERIGRVVSVTPDYLWRDNLPEVATVASANRIAAALQVWQRYAEALSQSPFESIDMLNFELGPDDREVVVYSDMSRPEMTRIDKLASQGRLNGVPREVAK